MSILIAILLLCAIVAGWTVYPLLSAESDLDRGDGLEAEGRLAAWTEEKDRLVAEMVALDMALSEGRINEGDYNVQRSLVMSEAEKAAGHLGKLRAGSGARSSPSRTYPRVAVGLALGLIVSGSALAIFLNGHDLRTDANPHADGRIPLPATAVAQETGAPPAPAASASPNGAGTPPVHADGTPDVGAMVARLEERVKGPDATVDDVIMLARSYRVLEREEDSLALYRRAQTMAPEDEGLKLVLASALIRSGSDAYRGEGEKLVDGILQTEPKKPEALWLKSLGLIHRHEIGQARQILTELDGLVSANSDAKNAVSELLKSLAAAPPAPAGADAAVPAPKAPEADSAGDAK